MKVASLKFAPPPEILLGLRLCKVRVDGAIESPAKFSNVRFTSSAFQGVDYALPGHGFWPQV